MVAPGLSAGGAERVLVTLANRWVQRGWSVTLLTMDDGSAPPFYSLHPTVDRHALGLVGDSGHPARAVRNNAVRVVRLRQAISRTHPEVVISFVDTTNVLVLGAAVGVGAPVIVSERIDPHHHPIPPAWNVLRRLTYPRAGGVVVQTQRAASYFPTSMQRRVHVIPNPVCLPDGMASPGQRAGMGSSGCTVMAMGRLVDQKGFDLLIMAFSQIAAAHPAWHLTIWGEGPLRSCLEETISRLGLEDRVSLPGRTLRPFVEMRRSDLFVLSSRYEGFPNVLCEAMACGLPVLSFDCPSGPAEIIRDGVDGVLVPAADVPALASGLRALMADEPYRRRLAGRAVEVVERFAIERVMDQWEDVINGALT